MSRPCFALSVMLSFLAISLVAVEKTHGGDDPVSPSHGASECILCPLAHGDPYRCAEVPCADYSDYGYDYNEYRYEDDPAPVPPAPADAATAGVPQGDGYLDDYYLSEYDWYGEDICAEPTALDDSDIAAVEEEESPESAATNETTPRQYDDFEYYSGYESYEDFVDGVDASSDSSQATETAKAESVVSEEVLEVESAGSAGWSGDVRDLYDGHESYEQFLYAAPNPGKIGCYAGYPSYEAFVQAGDEESPAASEQADAETDWAGDEYGYYDDYESYIQEYEFDAPAAANTTEDAETTAEELLQTGYDPAYDDAMNPAANSEPITADESSTADSNSVYDEYESYYEAYDELYNFESQAESETQAAVRLGPVIAEFEAAGPTSLDEFVADLISSVMRDLKVGIPQQATASEVGVDVDEVAAEATAGPSIILSTAQGLDRAAASLQRAAGLLRQIAAGGELQIGRAVEDEVAR